MPLTTRTPAQRTAELLDTSRYTQVSVTRDGYSDVLGDDAPPVHNTVQRLMRTKIYSAGYQIGRPIGLKLAAGPQAPGRDEDRARISEWLNLRAGATVLDIGCGPGNFTGWFGSQVFPDGLAVGVDASHSMLQRAVADNSGPSVAYLRADAEGLPFADEVADAVSCLAALYLINNPFQAIEELARVLKPSGRIVILTSLAPGGAAGTLRAKALNSMSGIRMFGHGEIISHLRYLGLTVIRHDARGLAQTVVATKPVD